jgi:hypothetical protein
MHTLGEEHFSVERADKLPTNPLSHGSRFLCLQFIELLQ